jgi:hypothetical protein
MKMTTANNIQNILLFVIKFIIFCPLVSLLGLIKGLILSILLNNVYNMIMNKLFGLELLSTLDLNFVSWESERQYNIIGASVFEGKNKEKLRKIIIERTVTFFKKMRQKIVFVLGNYYWKEFSVEEAINQIKFIDDKLNTTEEINAKIEELVRNPFDLNEFVWRIYLCENDNNQTVMIMQNDHSFGDGMGFVSFTSKLSDGFDITKFPKLKDKSLLERLMNSILIPFFIPYVLYIVYLTKNGRSPFKVYKPHTGIKKRTATKLYKFKTLYNTCKKMGVTYNDYLLNIVTAASKKYCRALNYNEINSMTCIIPVNLRSTPKSEADLKLTNESGGAMCKFEFIDDPFTECSKIKKITDYRLRNHIFSETLLFLNSCSNNYLPFIINRQVNLIAANNYDFLISNVPGPVEPVYMAGMKLLYPLGLPSPGPHGAFISTITFYGEAQITFTIDKAIEADANEFIKHIEREIEITIGKAKSE